MKRKEAELGGRLHDVCMPEKFGAKKGADTNERYEANENFQTKSLTREKPF